MTRHTLRSVTNPTSRQKRQPTSQWGTAPTSPCLLWRPRSVDRGSRSPGSGRGLWEQHEGVTCPREGVYTHTVGSFSLIFGGGEDRGRGWDTVPIKCLVNKDIAPLTEPSYDCLSSSTLPAEHGPHCLPYCNTTNSHIFSPRFRPSRPKTWRDSGRARPGQAFLCNSSEGTR